MPEETSAHEEPPLVALRSFPKLALAREAALALSAREIAHRIDRAGKNTWVLSVEEPARAAAEEELAAYEAEQAAHPGPPPERAPGVEVEPWVLLTAGSIMAAGFTAQQRLGEWIVDAGNAESTAIIGRGEWWRCVTALLLHGDLGHLLANLGFGLFFATFCVMQFGAGLSWLLIVASGAIGNALNAWCYRGSLHRSIGASTAVFAALGLLVGAEVYHRLAFPGTRTRRHLFAPIGAGLALLAYLGVGEAHSDIDFMAHGWGFLVGVLLGIPATAAPLRHPLPAWGQSLAGWLTLLVVAVSWFLALRA